MISTSYLRVYEPLSAFSVEERERWQAPIELIEDTERDNAHRWLIAGSLQTEPVLAPREGAFVREVDGTTFVCPWRTRLRMLAGLLAFRGSVPEEVAEAFVSEEDAQRAAHALANLGDDHPDIRSHILHANWHVPLRWFVPFAAEDRVITEDRDGLRIRYETSLDQAVDRLEHAVSVLERSWIDAAIVDTVKELLAWLQGFSIQGLLELDYGSVASIFDADELLEDRSAEDVWSCLDSLAAGDVLRAGRLFGELTDRWTAIRAREVVN